MLGKIVISVNKNYYFLEINGFSRKTKDNTVIVIKSIRNINKLGNDDTLFNYVASFKDEKLMRLVKIK